MSLTSRLRDYVRADLRADGVAGLSVAFVLIPQALAYSMLAGLPPVVGLYAAAIPAFAYALMGTSRHLAVGPVALTCLLIAGGLEPLAEAGTEEYESLAVLLAFMVAAIFGVLGLVRAGVLVNFLSHPTIVGFNAAAGLITAGSQIRPFFGIPRESLPALSATRPWPALAYIGDAHVPTLLVAVLALASLIAMRRFAPKLPAYLIVCVVGILGAKFLNLDARGVAVVGEIPMGLPRPHIPHPDWETVRALIPAAISIVVVGYGSSMTVAKALAAQARDRVRPNKELVAFSLANFAAGLFGAFPVTAALARSTVTAQAGARTRLTGVVAGACALATLLFAGPAFFHLPDPVLAAIVVLAASRLIDVASLRSVFKTKRNDGITAVLTCAGTLAIGLEVGLLLGILVALVFFVGRTTRPHTAELGRIPGSQVYRNVTRFEVETCPQVGVLRIDAPLYYANARFLEDRIHQMFVDRPAMTLLVLDCASVNDVDATAVQSLGRVVETLRANGNDLHLVSLIGPVRDLLARSGFTDRLGAGHAHRSLLESAPVLMKAIARDYCEGQCRSAAFPDCSLIPRRALTRRSDEKARFSPQI